MLTLFVLIPLCALFSAINVIIVCYIMIRLGYGPPNWQTALNLVVPLTTLQDHLNDGREWIDKHAPWADKLLNRIHVPKPIIIVDTTPIEEEEEVTDEMQDESENEQTGEAIDIPVEEILQVSNPHVPETPAMPTPSPPVPGD